MDKFNIALNNITDYMYRNDIHSNRLSGISNMTDLAAMGTPFHKYVYEQLRSLPDKEQMKALKTIQKARF